MTRTLLLVLPLLNACDGVLATCHCIEPSGPEVDFTAAQDEVEAVFAGTRTGTVSDDPGDGRNGVVFEACALDGEAFTLTLEVGDPIDCGVDEDHPEEDDCTSAREAVFPLMGTLTVGDGEPKTVDGYVLVWSNEAGLGVFEVALNPPDGDFPHQTLDTVLAGDLLDDMVITGLSWGRRLSGEDDATTVWEVCALDFPA